MSVLQLHDLLGDSSVHFFKVLISLYYLVELKVFFSHFLELLNKIELETGLQLRCGLYQIGEPASVRV